MSSPTRLTVLISGNGSNLQALIDASTSPSPSTLPTTTITRVISNRRTAYGLHRATTASLPTHYHNLLAYTRTHPAPPSAPAKTITPQAREAYDADLAALILADGPDLVVCAGWMHILSAAFLAPLEEAGVPVINLHPALPGEFNGAGAIERAWERGRQEGGLARTGVMVHYVIGEVDCGEPIITEEVELKKDERLEDLESRMHTVEHRLIVEGTRIAIKRLLKERKRM